MKIFLVGFMGCGKTSVGKKLAKKINYTFIDLDKAIEERSQKTIPQIFKENGEDSFRQYETQILKELIIKENTIISTGGGAPCFYDNMEMMNQYGSTIYLKMNVSTLVNRLMKAKTQRPLIKGKSEKELAEYITDTLNYREKFYLKAKYIIEARNLKVEEIINLIKE